MKTITIAHHIVGQNRPCFIIAEAGVNHDGEVDVAHELIDVAAEAGADAIKFQTFAADELATLEAPKATYQAEPTREGESQRDMLRRLELSRDAHASLKVHCEQRGLIFLSTPFDPGSVVFLADLGVAAFKVPSLEIVNLPFLRQIARYGRPMIVSTGNSTMADVEIAARTIEAETTPYSLLHCVSQYPTNPRDVNLRAMATLAQAYGVPVGFSDHTMGTAVPIAAAALGAAIVEKHITLDRGRDGPDHRASLEPSELASMIRDIRAVEAALGDGRKRPTPGEMEIGLVARKSLVAARDLAAGTILASEDLAAKRPGTGISPALTELVLGRRLRTRLASGAAVSFEILD